MYMYFIVKIFCTVFVLHSLGDKIKFLELELQAPVIYYSTTNELVIIKCNEVHIQKTFIPFTLKQIQTGKLNKAQHLSLLSEK